MSVTTVTDTSSQLALREKLLSQGYTPLPVRNKQPTISGWQNIDVTPENIVHWDRQSYANCTGIRLTGRIIAIDMDVDDETVCDRIMDAACQIAPALVDAPMRLGKGAKVCFLARMREGDPLYARWRSNVFNRPGDTATKPVGHAVEIFSSHSSRHIGVYGAHSTADDGTVHVHYRWSPGPTPLDTAPDALPEVTAAELQAISERASEIMAGAGWARDLRAVSGKGGVEIKYTLTDASAFDCIDGVTRQYTDMVLYARSRDPRCSASFSGEIGADRRDRCQIGVTREHGVYVYDHATYVSHRHVSERKETPGELSAKIAQALLDKGVVDEDQFAALVSDDPFAEAVTEVAHRYAYCPPLERFLRIDGSPDSVSKSALMDAYRHRDLHYKTEKGARKRMNAINVLIDSGSMVQVAGRRYRPASTDRIVVEGKEAYINAYLPPEHVLPFDAKDCTDLWQDFIAHLVPHEGEREWFFDWLAHIAQRPHIPGVAVLHVSDDVMGTGRGTLADIMRGVCGPHNVGEQDMEVITGSSSQAAYNDWLVDRVLIEVAEVSPEDGYGTRSRMDRRAEDRLKRLIDPRPRAVTINRKFMPQYTEIVAASFFLATNRHDALAGISDGDRRFVILRGPDTPLRAVPDLFDRVLERRDTVGFDPGFCAAVWHWLMDRDLSAFDAQRPVDFGGKADMARADYGELDEIIDRMLTAYPLQWGPVSMLADRVHAMLRAEGKENIFGSDAVTRREIGRLLRKRWPHGAKGRLRIGDTVVAAAYATRDEFCRVRDMPMPDREVELTRARMPRTADNVVAINRG